MVEINADGRLFEVIFDNLHQPSESTCPQHKAAIQPSNEGPWFHSTSKGLYEILPPIWRCLMSFFINHHQLPEQTLRLAAEHYNHTETEL